MGILNKIFGTYSERELRRVNPIVNKIESLDEKMQSLKDEDFKLKTEEFKSRLEKGEKLDDIYQKLLP